MNVWDAEMVGRIAIQLRASPAELCYFLSKVEAADDDDSNTNNASPDMCYRDTLPSGRRNWSRSLIPPEAEYALLPEGAAERHRLEVTFDGVRDVHYNSRYLSSFKAFADGASTTFEPSQTYSRVAINDICDYTQFSVTARPALRDYFRDEAWLHLQVLDLAGTRPVESVLSDLMLANTEQTPFPSLVLLKLDRTDLTDGLMNRIYLHFCGYEYFLRDKLVTHNGVAGARVCVQINDTNGVRDFSRPTSHLYPVAFRSGEADIKGPLIFSAGYI